MCFESCTSAPKETLILVLVDAFDLPEWLGTEPVTWQAQTTLGDGPLVSGELRGADAKAEPLDLLAVDSAYPQPVCDDESRRAAHQAWQFGEVLLVERDGRTAAAVPGSGLDANHACEVLRRVAKAVGAAGSSFTVSIAV